MPDLFGNEVPCVLVLRWWLFGGRRGSAKVGAVVETKDGLEVQSNLKHEKGLVLYRLRWSTCRGVTFVGNNVFVERTWPHRNAEFYAQDCKAIELRRLFAPLSKEALEDPKGPDFSALAKLLSSQMVYAESGRGPRSLDYPAISLATPSPMKTAGREVRARVLESPFAAKIRQARSRAGLTSCRSEPSFDSTTASPTDLSSRSSSVVEFSF
jgi:hypothetical protein